MRYTHNKFAIAHTFITQYKYLRRLMEITPKISTGAYSVFQVGTRIYIEIKTREIRQNELFKMAQPVFQVTHAVFEFYRFCRKITGFQA